MLFTNSPMKVIEKKMSFGTVTGTTIGESGRGRHEVFLPTPKDLKEGITKGLNYGLTIGASKTGRPRVNRCSANSEEIFLILSSERDYTRKGSGRIEAPEHQSTEIIARGNGADGDAGRIGTWDVLILKAHDGDVFRVVWSGYEYGYEDTFYVVLNNTVYAVEESALDVLCENLEINTPFAFHFKDSRVQLVADEWVVL